MNVVQARHLEASSLWIFNSSSLSTLKYTALGSFATKSLWQQGQLISIHCLEYVGVNYRGTLDLDLDRTVQWQ